MDRSSNSVKIEKIRRAIEAEEYPKALGIAKTVDTARIKSAADLSVIAEAYFKNGEYETALVYFEQIYQKRKSRRILMSLINLCLKLSMADMAESYLKDFEEMAPQDFYCHIFRYRIDKMRGESLDVLIYDLEQLKEDNYMEDWAYELARLYYKNGQSKKCVAECDDIILWFGSGVYVDRARGLRAMNLANRPVESLTDFDRALVKEVRKMVDAGKSAEEVENFIEESTTPEGGQGGYSEEEYRKERFGKPPVYEEEGEDVIWYTKEFGPVTEEMLRQQNTMDMLQGMQVARQIKMQIGDDREMQVEGAERKDAYAGRLHPEAEALYGDEAPAGESPGDEDFAGIGAFIEDEASAGDEAFAENGAFVEDEVSAEGKVFSGDKPSAEGRALTKDTVRAGNKILPEREGVSTKGRTASKERMSEAKGRAGSGETKKTAEQRQKNNRTPQKKAPVKKGFLARYKEKIERKKEGKVKKKEQELQEIMQSALGEEKLYHMIMEEEQAAELSKAVQSVADEVIMADLGSSPKRNKAAREGKVSPQGRAALQKEVPLPEGTVSRKEALMEEGAVSPEEESIPEEMIPQEEMAVPSKMALPEEKVLQEEAAQADEKEEEIAEEEPVHIFQYPGIVLPIAFHPEDGRFYSLLEKKGRKPEDFFAEFMASEGFRQKLLQCMEQLFEPDNKNITMIITGSANSGRTLLAKSIAKCLQELGVMTSPKVAIIRGRKLNRIRLAEKKDQLKDTTLIIEAASEMLPGKIIELLSMKEEFAGTTAIILEDERSKINRILQENQELGNVYRIRADLPEWTPDDFFLQALAMLAAKDFQIEETAAIRFLENIRSQIEKNLDGAFEAVHAYTEQVIRTTEKRMAAELKMMILEGRYAEADLMLLKTEDL